MRHLATTANSLKRDGLPLPCLKCHNDTKWGDQLGEDDGMLWQTTYCPHCGFRAWQQVAGMVKVNDKWVRSK